MKALIWQKSRRLEPEWVDVLYEIRLGLDQSKEHSALKPQQDLAHVLEQSRYDSDGASDTN
jgi:hypothetical protein